MLAPVNDQAAADHQLSKVKEGTAVLITIRKR